MTCVLGMVVNREREIRNFKKTSFYRLVSGFMLGDKELNGEWRVGTEKSKRDFLNVIKLAVIANQFADWCGNLLLKMGIPTGADAPSE